MNNIELENASDEIKLAVDIIYLFERNQVSPITILKALEIVKKDAQQKLKKSINNKT